MNQETMLHHLEELAERLGIGVRYESAAGRVGVCMLRGERVAVIDSNLRMSGRVAALSSVLADEELDGVYIPPEIRRRIDRSCPLRVRPGDAEEHAQSSPRSDGGEDAPSEPDSAGPEADAEETAR